MTTLERLQQMLDPAQRRRDGGMLRHVPHVTCADGFSMSVQASEFHYCSPRDSYGPWYAAEVGFPSERVEEFMPYIDGEDSEPTKTVYGYVPLSTVAAVIDAHGGFASGIEAASAGETAQQARPEGREPGPEGETPK